LPGLSPSQRRSPLEARHREHLLHEPLGVELGWSFPLVQRPDQLECVKGTQPTGRPVPPDIPLGVF
jgi:hypothetical protein